MEANLISSNVDAAWQDASAYWKDNYASRYRIAVIVELENSLSRINNSSKQLNDVIDDMLSSLRQFTG